MNNRKKSIATMATFFLTALMCLPGFKGQAHGGERPNFIIILADDLGVGDIDYRLDTDPLSTTYNQPVSDNSTPNLATLARDGMKLTSFYSTSPTCSPARAGLMTGRHSRYTNINRPLNPPDKPFLDHNELTLAEGLKAIDGSYRTGIVGKWHLGHGPQDLPTYRDQSGRAVHGFDYFYGITMGTDNTFPGLCLNEESSEAFSPLSRQWYVQIPVVADASRDFIPSQVTSHTEYRSLVCPSTVNAPDWATFKTEHLQDNPLYADSAISVDTYTFTRILTDKAIQFITESKSAGRPFFLYLAYSAPHCPYNIHCPTDQDQPITNGSYQCSVDELDRNVGRVLTAVDTTLGIGSDTVIFFLSDNGPDDGSWLQYHYSTFPPPANGDPMPRGSTCLEDGPCLKGGKWYNYEGGVRVPFLSRWKNPVANPTAPTPGKYIPHGVNTDPASIMDLFSTMITMADVADAKLSGPFNKDPKGELTGLNIGAGPRNLLHVGELTSAATTYNQGRLFHFYWPTAEYFQLCVDADGGPIKSECCVDNKTAGCNPSMTYHLENSLPYAIRWNDPVDQKEYKYFTADYRNHLGSVLYDLADLTERVSVATTEPNVLRKFHLAEQAREIQETFPKDNYPLYFPDLYDGAAQWANYVTVQARKTGEAVKATVTFYEINGTLTLPDKDKCPSCTNPASLVIAPYQKAEFTPNTMLYGTGQNKLFNGTIIVVADKPIVGMTNTLGPAAEAFGLNEAAKARKNLIFNKVIDNQLAFEADAAVGVWETILEIQNVDGIPVRVDIDLYDAAGNQAGRLANKTIPARGKLELRPTSFSGTSAFLGTAHVTVLSKGLVAGTARVQFFHTDTSGKTLAAITIEDALDPKLSGHLPSLYDGFTDVTGRKTTNYISVLNANDVPATVNLFFYNPTGTLVHQHIAVVNPHAKLDLTPSWLICDQYANQNPSLCPTDYAGFAGSAVIQASVPVFSSTNTIFPSTVADIEAFDIYEAAANTDTLIFPKINDGFSNWKNEAFIQNTDSAPHQVTVTFHDSAGNLLKSVASVIPAHGQYSFFPQTLLATPTRNAMTVTSDAPDTIAGVLRFTYADSLHPETQTISIYPGIEVPAGARATALDACNGCHGDKTANVQCDNTVWRTHTRKLWLSTATTVEIERTLLGYSCTDMTPNYTGIKKDRRRKIGQR